MHSFIHLFLFSSTVSFFPCLFFLYFEMSSHTVAFSWSSLCSQSWPQTHGNPPATISQVLVLKTWAIKYSSILVNNTWKSWENTKVTIWTFKFVGLKWKKFRIVENSVSEKLDSIVLAWLLMCSGCGCEREHRKRHLRNWDAEVDFIARPRET